MSLEFTNEYFESSLEDENSLSANGTNIRAKIREQLATMSFEDIQKLKEKIGSKLYNETLFATKTKKQNINFKRENKNRPREISSKIRPKLKQAPALTKKTAIPRDPRFDSLCGEYDEKTFKSNYKFVNDIKRKERKELYKELQITTDPERKQQIQYLMQRIDNQLREEEKKEKLKQLEFEEKSEIREKIKRGEKPTYKKKSEKNIDQLLQKYEDLKKTNTLQKHIKSRSKKLLHKDRKAD
ncbi:hypothetical protein WA026_005084 [Henosepilachna vigintioctopunctata]|uniref:rRNA biogenesis protein RRP36 n=1 Tax=Henosepilachna vigintioctopunctata TaxID=420089 RepID=A0AAW1UUF8_9CUCU